MKRVIPFFLCLLAATAAQSQTAEPVNLTTEEVVALVKGKAISTDNTRWGVIRLDFDNGSTVYASGNGFNNRGTWRVTDGKLCLDGPQFDFEGCGVMRRVGGQIQHLWPKGDVHFVVRNP